MMLPGKSYAWENGSAKRVDGVSARSLGSSAYPAVKSSKKQSGLTSLIVAVERSGVVWGGFNQAANPPLNCEELMDVAEHSTDGGKTWKPCGVEE